MERSEYNQSAAVNVLIVACFAFILSAFGATIFALIKLILAEYSIVEQNALLRIYLS